MGLRLQLKLVIFQSYKRMNPGGGQFLIEGDNHEKAFGAQYIKAQFSQPFNLSVFQVVYHIPQMDAVKAVGSVVEVMPDVGAWWFLAQAPVEADEHVADIYAFETTRKESDGLTASRSDIQHLGTPAFLNGFNILLQHHAGISNGALFRI